MKEVMTVASNFSASFKDDGGLVPMVEVILVLSEPIFRYDEGGGVGKFREATQSRFMAHPETLRQLSKAFLEYADESEKLAAKRNPTNQTGE